MIAVRRRPPPPRRHLPWLIGSLVLAVLAAVLAPLGLANARPYEIDAGGSVGREVDAGDPMSLTTLTIRHAVWEEVAGQSVLRVELAAACRWGLFTAGTWSFFLGSRS